MKLKEELKYTKGVIRICNSKMDGQHKGDKKDKQRLSTKHYTEN